MKIGSVAAVIGLAISFALPIFAQEKEKVTPFPFAPIPAGPQLASSEQFNLWAAHLILGSVISGGASPLLRADPSAIPGAAVQPQSEQVQTSPVQPSDKPKVFGVKPVRVDIHWTAYYVTPVEKTAPGKGHPILVMDSTAIARLPPVHFTLSSVISLSG